MTNLTRFKFTHNKLSTRKVQRRTKPAPQSHIGVESGRCEYSSESRSITCPICQLRNSASSRRACVRVVYISNCVSGVFISSARTRKEGKVGLGMCYASGRLLHHAANGLNAKSPISNVPSRVDSYTAKASRSHKANLCKYLHRQESDPQPQTQSPYSIKVHNIAKFCKELGVDAIHPKRLLIACYIWFLTVHGITRL